jgi:N-succinyldiaminopimelate aminotransferase
MDKRVVTIPSSVFYDSSAGDNYVRLAFCKRPEVLDEALIRLKGASS